VRSDPAYNSDDGYETRYCNPSDPEEEAHYKTDNAYDSDVISTQAHLKQAESDKDHKLNPIKFLTQQEADI
jgi:hypothetical protein